MRKIVTYAIQTSAAGTERGEEVISTRPYWEVWDGAECVAAVWYARLGGGWFVFTAPDSRRCRTLGQALKHAVRAPPPAKGWAKHRHACEGR